MNTASALSIVIATLLAGAAMGGLAVWLWAPPRKRLSPLPTHWNLAARRALNTHERRFYNQLRLAFPKCIVLPKLALVRLCQPATPEQVTYWYELIGAAHVSFALCNPNGHVLLVIDLDGNRSHSRRSTKIKDSVLAACGIQRVQYAADVLPSIDELRALTMGVGAAEPASETISAPTPSTTIAPTPVFATTPALAPSAVSADLTPTAPRTETPGNGQDPKNVFLDSFFTTDDRPGSESASESAPDLTDWPPVSGPSPLDDGAAVTDAASDGTRWRRSPVRLASGR